MEKFEAMRRHAQFMDRQRPDCTFVSIEEIDTGWKSKWSQSVILIEAENSTPRWCLMQETAARAN